MLERTMAWGFEPGSNLRQTDAGSDWLYLLGDVTAGTAVCFGEPETWLQRRFQERNGKLVVFTSSADLIWPEDSVEIDRPDVVVISATRAVRRLLGHPEVRATLLQWTASGVPLYVRATNRNSGFAVESTLKRLGVSQRLVLGPNDPDSCYTSSKAPSSSTVAWRLPHDAPRWKKSRWWTAGRSLIRLSRTRLGLGRETPSHASDTRQYSLRTHEGRLSRSGSALVLPVGTGSGLPGWARNSMSKAGLAIPDLRWSFAPSRGYRSQKLLLFLSSSDSLEPHFVIKMTQHPRYNARLDNERRSLEYLEEAGIVDPEVVPRVVFSGLEGGLLTVVETAVPGVQFRVRGMPTADNPFVVQAVESITRLGQDSAHFDPSEGGGAASALGRIVEEFDRAFSPSQRHRWVLDQLVETLAGVEAVPAVFQHGDPGIWNLLVTPADHVAFLDWENGDPDGMPLWDLFLFLKTVGSWQASHRGIRYSAAVFAQQFLADSSMSLLMGAAIRDYCDRVGLADEALAPIFVGCWLHQALKEATRLPSDDLNRGRSLGIVEVCLDRMTDVDRALAGGR